MSCIRLKEDEGCHDYFTVSKEWQEYEPTVGAIIKKAAAVVICRKCGELIDPFSPEPIEVAG